MTVAFMRPKKQTSEKASKESKLDWYLLYLSMFYRSVFSSNIKQQKQTNDDSKNNNDNG